MSDPVSALNGASFDGFAAIREIGPLGMITLRAGPDAKGLAAAVKAATGLTLPRQRRIVTASGNAAAWMSPDEYLLITPYKDAAKAIEKASKKLDTAHHLLADVSDARAVFRIEGGKVAQVIAKLCPADLDGLADGEIRRTRAAQAAVAFWRDEAGFTLVCFRSVAGYVMGLLTHAAQPGSELLSP